MKIAFWQKFRGSRRRLPLLLALVGAGCSSPAASQSPERTVAAQTTPPSEQPGAIGQKLFLKNCAHCHGADAAGDEGPNLHTLDWTDEQMARRIRVGKKGQMTAFAGKLSDQDIRALIGYLRSLK